MPVKKEKGKGEPDDDDDDDQEGEEPSRTSFDEKMSEAEQFLIKQHGGAKKEGKATPISRAVSLIDDDSDVDFSSTDSERENDEKWPRRRFGGIKVEGGKFRILPVSIWKVRSHLAEIERGRERGLSRKLNLNFRKLSVAKFSPLVFGWRAVPVVKQFCHET